MDPNLLEKNPCKSLNAKGNFELYVLHHQLTNNWKIIYTSKKTSVFVEM